jgi:hypothetical protein
MLEPVLESIPWYVALYLEQSDGSAKPFASTSLDGAFVTTVLREATLG